MPTRSKIGQDVPVEVRGDDRVQRVRFLNHPDGHRVHQHLVPFDVWKVLCHQLSYVIPEDQSVSLCRTAQDTSFERSLPIGVGGTFGLTMELLFVTTVKNFLGLFLASSKANRMTLSIPFLVKIPTSVAASHSVPTWVLPP